MYICMHQLFVENNNKTKIYFKFRHASSFKVLYISIGKLRHIVNMPVLRYASLILVTEKHYMFCQF